MVGRALELFKIRIYLQGADSANTLAHVQLFFRRNLKQSQQVLLHASQVSYMAKCLQDLDLNFKIISGP